MDPKLKALMAFVVMVQVLAKKRDTLSLVPEEKSEFLRKIEVWLKEIDDHPDCDGVDHTFSVYMLGLWGCKYNTFIRPLIGPDTGTIYLVLKDISRITATGAGFGRNNQLLWKPDPSKPRFDRSLCGLTADDLTNKMNYVLGLDMR